MTLDEAIIARRSIRSYELEELEPEFIDELVDFLSDLTVPDDSIDWNFDILPLDEMCHLVNGVPRLQAPHYLVIRSVQEKNCLQNAGYIGEMAVLWLTARGIGSCWQDIFCVRLSFERIYSYCICSRSDILLIYDPILIIILPCGGLTVRIGDRHCKRDIWDKLSGILIGEFDLQILIYRSGLELHRHLGA